MKLEISWKILEKKYLQISNFMKIRLLGNRRTDKRTDIKKLRLAVSNFDNKPKSLKGHKTCVLISSTNLSEIFLTLRRAEQMSTQICVGLHAKYPLFLSGSSKYWLLSIDFRKIIPISNSMTIRPQAAELFHADGRKDRWRDRRNEANFRNFWERA